MSTLTFFIWLAALLVVTYIGWRIERAASDVTRPENDDKVDRRLLWLSHAIWGADLAGSIYVTLSMAL